MYTGLISSILPKTAIGPTTTTKSIDSAKDSNLPMELMADSFTSLLVDLFTMLPAGSCQELFATLYKVYPTPRDVKQCMEIGRYDFQEWQKRLLDGASALSQLRNSTFLPEEPLMEDFEQQLEEASRNYRYGTRSYHRAKARLRTQSDHEQAYILQLCRTRFSVSTSHISFLEQLYKRLQEAGAPLQFEIRLLLAQVSNCTVNDWTHGEHSFGDHHLCDHLLASDDIGSSIETLKNMWMFSISPENALELLEAVKDRASPQLADVMCDILISVLDCKASLHPRIMTLLLTIGAKPEHILQAVNVVNCSISGSKMNPNQCRTTVVQCVEALGKSYSKHKASGVAEATLLKLRFKAADLLQHARYIRTARSARQHGHGLDPYQSTVDIQSVMEIVCDSGQQALTDLLALMVMHPRECLLPSLNRMNELCNYYHKDKTSEQSRLLKVSPFKKTVASLLEKRKNEIKTLAASRGETSKLRDLREDLRASFQFLGVEAGFTTFEQDLASVLRNADRQDRQLLMPWYEVYDTEDGEENLGHEAAVARLMSTARVRRMGFFW